MSGKKKRILVESGIISISLFFFVSKLSFFPFSHLFVRAQKVLSLRYNIFLFWASHRSCCQIFENFSDIASSLYLFSQRFLLYTFLFFLLCSLWEQNETFTHKKKANLVSDIISPRNKRMEDYATCSIAFFMANANFFSRDFCFDSRLRCNVF